LVSAFDKGNDFLSNFRIKERRYIIVNLMIGLKDINITAAPKAFHLFWVVRREAPK